MSEVLSRPAASRGRSTTRGGRGAHASRPRNSKSNGDIDTSADQGELGELKKQYSSQLSTLKELFPDWTDMDLVVALQETDGDLQSTIERITEGHVSQFAEIKKPKDRARSKVKDTALDTASGQGRGTRPRAGPDASRGARGRTERGRGGFRGARGAAHPPTNGARTASGATSVPTTESTAWETSAATTDNAANADKTATGEGAPAGQWGSVVASKATPATASEGQKPALLPDTPAKKTWASALFSKPKPAPAPAPKPVAQPPAPASQPPPAEEKAAPEQPATEPVHEEPTPVEEPAGHEVQTPTDVAASEAAADEPVPEAKPAELTQDNVEHLPDSSVPAPTGTAASTVASSRDIGSAIATPLQPPSQTPIGRPTIGGYATTALKATGTPHRSASFQRKILEQQEAVVMPGNHAVDRAAVQFGSMDLNGEADADLDVDEDREDAETRTQPPQHSPTAQPRASLPPAPRQPSAPVEAPMQETPKQAPGLPPPSQQQQPLPSQQSPNPLAAQAMQTQGSQSGQQYGQFGRYGQAVPSETGAPAQKPYDPFGQQVPQLSQFESYGAQSQAPSQANHASHMGAFSSAPGDYSSYQTSDYPRYSYYGSAYGQNAAVSQVEAGSAQPRTGSAFGSGPADTFPSSQAQTSQSRYAETTGSGHTTPNPAISGPLHTAPQTAQAQHMHQPHAQAGHGQYPLHHPYYATPYYQSYMSQYGAYGQGGYGAFGAKGGMYGQPHHYGMSPQSSFDQHSSSPGNVGGFGRESAVGGGLSDFGRTSSGQPSQASQHSAAAGSFGGVPDVFGRSQGGFAGQQTYGTQQNTQQTSGDELKPFGDSKASGGPSPSALAQPGRPGSATQNTPGQASQALPPPQSHQQGFGGYPSQFSGQGSAYGGLGGLGGHQAGQSHQAGGYGGYGGFGGQYGSYGRGGWGGNYGGH